MALHANWQADSLIEDGLSILNAYRKNGSCVGLITNQTSYPCEYGRTRLGDGTPNGPAIEVKTVDQVAKVLVSFVMAQKIGFHARI